jgi:hypothetical protein
LTDCQRELLEQGLREYNDNFKKQNKSTPYKEEDDLIDHIHYRIAEKKCVDSEDIWKEIIEWKSPRNKVRAVFSSDVANQTRHAFELADREELSEAVDTLDSLPGVGARMATAVLMFFDPCRFTVMDFRAWRSLVYLGRISAFCFWFESSSDYPKFNCAVSQLRKDFGKTLRETDRALWGLEKWKEEIC